jgi:hypothetical protein
MGKLHALLGNYTLTAYRTLALILIKDSADRSEHRQAAGFARTK